MPDLQIVAGSDTPNAGRVKWNANDTELETRIANHKASADHDGRYYTIAAVDAGIGAVRDLLDAHKDSGDHDARYLKKSDADAAFAALQIPAREYTFAVDRGSLATGTVWAMIHGILCAPSRGYRALENGRLKKIHVNWEGVGVSFDVYDLQEILVSAGQTISVACTLLLDEDESLNILYSIQPVVYISGVAVASIPPVSCPAKILGGRYGIIQLEF